MGLSDHSLISEFRTPGPESGDIVARRWSIHRESSGINEQASARKHSIAFEAKSRRASSTTLNARGFAVLESFSIRVNRFSPSFLENTHLFLRGAFPDLSEMLSKGSLSQQESVKRQGSGSSENGAGGLFLSRSTRCKVTQAQVIQTQAGHSWSSRGESSRTAKIPMPSGKRASIMKERG